MSTASKAQALISNRILDWRRAARFYFLITLTFGVMTMGALVMVLVAVVTLFRARDFYAERLATPLAKLVLRIWGIRLKVHGEFPVRHRQVVYISNHTSTVDLFVLIALGLPNARFFLSGFLRKLVPLGIMAYLVGTIFTVPQDRPKKRKRIFQNAERLLRRTGESVYLSPEGERITTGEVGHFNKGSFHLATCLQVPMVPFYIQVPGHMNPGRGWDALPGTIQVFIQQEIDTSGWRVEDVESNRDGVRELFVQWHDRYRC